MNSVNKIAIFSDLHINGSNDSKYDKFLSLLNSIKQIDEVNDIWLAGDIFELLVGDYSFWQKEYHQFFAIINELAKQKNIIWIEGNHDFHLSHIAKNNIEICTKPKEFEITNYNNFSKKRIYLSHGDEFCSEDIKYQLWKIISRSKIFLKLFSFFPEKIIEKHIISKFQSKKNNQPSKESDNSYEIAKVKKLWQLGFDCVVCGHNHIQTLNIKENKTHINPGAWSDQKNSINGYVLWDPWNNNINYVSSHLPE